MDALVTAARRLRRAVRPLVFPPPVAFVYSPLDYAWAAHEAYLRRYGRGRKRIIFLGMNPGPFGMVQTGVPFGEIAAVRDWLGITASICHPPAEHPKRPVEGFDCRRSEISGRRLWGLFADKFGTANRFFADHFVANYCPVAFLEIGGRNLTPDKLRRSVAEPLYAACNEHLSRVVDALKPDWVIGVGEFAERQARQLLQGRPVRVARILHPSPASPAANRGWAAAATHELEALGIW